MKIVKLFVNVVHLLPKLHTASHILNSIILTTDMTIPELMLPSYTETNGRKLSSVSSHSTSQQSQDEDCWGVPF